MLPNRPCPVIRLFQAAAFLAMAFCVAPSVRAGELIPLSPSPDSMFGSVHQFSPSRMRGIELITAKECYAALRPIALPTDIIREGLDAVISQAFNPAPELACIETVLENWDKYADREVPLPKAPNTNIWSGGVNVTLQMNLEEQLKCFNPELPGSPAAATYAAGHKECEGKWLSSEEAKPLQAKFEKEAAQNNALMHRQMILGNQPSSLMNLWQQHQMMSFKFSSGLSLSEMMSCYSSADPGSDAYNEKAKTLPASCGGKILGQTQYLDAMKEYGKASISQAGTANYLRLYLKELERVNPKASVFSTSQRLLCFDSNEPGSLASRLHRQVNADVCSGFGFRPGNEAEAHRAKVAAEIEKLLPQVARWKKKRDAQALEEQREYDRLNPNRYDQYGTRRLFARFQNHLKRGGSREKLWEFCQTYEADQRRDQRYAAEKLNYAPFSDNKQWKAAAELGITEGELGALRAYTGSFYSEVNPALWKAEASGQPLDKRFAAYQESMLAALDRFPARPGVVRRFAAIPDKVLLDHEVGKVVTYGAYTSTSKNPEWDWSGGTSGNMHGFIIFGGPNAKDISHLSTSEGEQEVLFRSGTRFKVLSRKERPGKKNVYDFVMAEVDEAGNVAIPLPDVLPEPAPPKAPGAVGASATSTYTFSSTATDPSVSGGSPPAPVVPAGIDP